METHHQHQQVHTHICHQCGWSYPNHHPSAKQRRAHKKLCGKKLHESQDEDEDEEIRGCLVGRQVSSKSVEEDYSDAVTEFTDSDLKASNGDSRMDLIVGSKEMENGGLGKTMVRNESASFYEDSLQVQEDSGHPSDIGPSISSCDEKEARENMLAPDEPASMPSEGLQMAEGREETIPVESRASPTKESGVTVDMGVHDTTSGYMETVLSCKMEESDHMPPIEDSHQQAPMCCGGVPTEQGAGIFDAKDVGRGQAHIILSDAHDFHCDNHIECSDKTDQQFVGAYGSLGLPHDAVIGNGTVNTTTNESVLSVVNTVPSIQNSSSMDDGNNIKGFGDVDSQHCHFEIIVEDLNKYEMVSVGTSVSGKDPAEIVSSDCSTGPLNGEKKFDDSLETKVIQNGAELKASAANTASYVLNSSSMENSDKIMGLGDENSHDCLYENKFESSKSLETRNTETSVGGTDQVAFVNATDSTKPLEGEREHKYAIEAEMIQNASEKSTSGKSIPSAEIELSVSGADQVLFSGADAITKTQADDSIKPLVEERGNELIFEAGLIQNGVQKLIASAGVKTSFDGIDHLVFSGVDDSTKPLLGEGKFECITEAEVVQNGAKNAKSGESVVTVVNSVPCLLNSSAMEDGDQVFPQISKAEENSVLEKQLKSMALVILNHTESQFNSAGDDGGSFSGTIPPSISALSMSSEVTAETLPGTSSLAQKEETQVLESITTISGEGQQLSNTSLRDVPSSKTLDVSSKAKEAHGVSEIQAIQNPQQAHASTLKAALDEVLQGRKKNEETSEKMSSRSLRAPLKSFLAEPIFDNRQEATVPGHPEQPTYEDGTTSKAQGKIVPTTTGPELSTKNGSKKYTDREWDSPARLPKNEQKRRVRWPPFLCCLQVPSDRSSLVGAD